MATSQIEKEYYVANEEGGYAETFTFDDAIELAKNDSIKLGGMFHVAKEFHKPAVIFYDGYKYIPASDTCTHEWEPLDDDDDGWYLQVCKHCGLEDSGVRETGGEITANQEQTRGFQSWLHRK